MPSEQLLRRCVCPCHTSSSPASIVERYRADGVPTNDVIEAACACSKCLNTHADALLSMRLANAPTPRVVDRVAWVDSDPKKTQADGEGDDGG
jgi:hypothetical protein